MRAAIIGPGGRVVRQICEVTGATSIEIMDDGVLEVGPRGGGLSEA